jgi:hypothetical protein
MRVVCVLASMVIAVGASAQVSFTEIASEVGISNVGYTGNLTVDDIDGDGDIDVYEGNIVWASFPINVLPRLYRNSGDGTFELVSGLDFPGYIGSVIWFDKDSDGDLDCFMTGGMTLPVCAYENIGEMSFAERTEEWGLGGVSAALAEVTDYDGDTWLDVVLTTSSSTEGSTVEIWLQRNGAFVQEVVQPTPTSTSTSGAQDHVSAFDYDRDQDPDLFVHDYASYFEYDTVTYLKANDGDLQGAFAATAVPGFPATWSTYSWVDVELDGDWDFFGSASDYHGGRNHLVVQGADGGWTDIGQSAGLWSVGLYTTSVAWGDFDLDGYADVFEPRVRAFASYTESQLFRNNGDATFANVSSTLPVVVAQYVVSCAWFDLEGDGDLDLLVGRTGDHNGPSDGSLTTNYLFRNDSAGLGHWLQVDLVGLGGNRRGLGAEIAVHAGGVEHLATPCGGSSRGISNNPHRVTVGLGAASVADSIIVRWRTGEVTRLYDVSADQLISIAQAPPGLNLPYAESFDDDTADDFNAITGDWAVVDGTYTCTNDSLGTKHISTVGEYDWSDYRVEFDIKSLGSPIQECLVRYQSPGDWYVVTVLPDPDSAVTIYKSVDGVETKLLEVHGLLNEAAVWHHMAVEVQGPDIRLEFDGVPVLQYRDEDEPFMTGKVGLSAFASLRTGWHQVFYDNISITESVDAFLMAAELADTPADEGGFVDITWPRSIYDAAALPDSVVTYRVERLEEGAWIEVALLPATHADTYTATVPNVWTATPGIDPVASTYRVVAMPIYPETATMSVELSGWSVDNIAPPRPIAYMVEDLDLRLIFWQVPGVADFAEACLYRGSEPNFVAGEPLICTTELGFNETNRNYWFYRVQFSDIHGNLSEWSDELHGQYPTSVPDALPKVLVLEQNVPNPFNPTTTIAYGLPKAGPISLRIYDLSGRLVRDLVAGEMRTAGRHEETWDGRDASGRRAASGTYFCRIEAGGEQRSMRMMLVK